MPATTFQAPERMEPAAPEGRLKANVVDREAASDAAASDAVIASASASASGARASPEASPSKQRYGDVRAVLVEGIDGRW